jgi:lipoyl(octanoyl) transferase
MKKVLHVELGRMDYQACWDLQKQVQQKIMLEKRAKQLGEMNEDERLPDVLFFVEHPHVYTLGKSGDENHLLANDAFLKQIEATYVPIDRGGDITYHGPGQLVGYPILDLDRYFTDLHKYLRYLEEVMIQVCADYGYEAGRKEKLTGTWVGEEKICAMGVKCSRWVTLHGFALNMNTDLNYFNYIVPCGITDKGVTSLQKLIGKPVDEQEVKEKVLSQFAGLFEVEIEKITLDELLNRIHE